MLFNFLLINIKIMLIIIYTYNNKKKCDILISISICISLVIIWFVLLFLVIFGNLYQSTYFKNNESFVLLFNILFISHTICSFFVNIKLLYYIIMNTCLDEKVVENHIIKDNIQVISPNIIPINNSQYVRSIEYIDTVDTILINDIKINIFPEIKCKKTIELYNIEKKLKDNKHRLYNMKNLSFSVIKTKNNKKLNNTL